MEFRVRRKAVTERAAPTRCHSEPVTDVTGVRISRMKGTTYRCTPKIPPISAKAPGGHRSPVPFNGDILPEAFPSVPRRPEDWLRMTGDRGTGSQWQCCSECMPLNSDFHAFSIPAEYSARRRRFPAGNGLQAGRDGWFWRGCPQIPRRSPGSSCPPGTGGIHWIRPRAFWDGSPFFPPAGSG